MIDKEGRRRQSRETNVKGCSGLTNFSSFGSLSQVHFLLQIIVNRCSILTTNKRRAWRLKVGVAVVITAVNISVYNIWIPARLQISERYIWINDWWDRCEKCIYLLVDGALNAYFIRIVKSNLIVHGLTKYRALAHFNMFIVGFSLSMDVLIISMMSLPNTFVYMVRPNVIPSPLSCSCLFASVAACK